MKLLEPGKLGRFAIANRVVMSPMTRNRASADGLANDMMRDYYAQRATAGLIITEGIQPSAVGQGYMSTAGLHTVEQAVSWRPVTDAVHERGSLIFAQLMHSGRVGHPTITGDGLVPVGPSAVAAAGEVLTPAGMQPFVTPVELTVHDIAMTISDHVIAAEHAMSAGFDGVEIHAGYGYLSHQFFAVNSNRREDEYGGEIAGRIKFTVELAQALSEAVGAGRVGIRISPGNGNNGVEEAETQALYVALLTALDPLGMAYVHIAEFGDRALTAELRSVWSGSVIVNPHPAATDVMVTPQVGEAALADGVADAVSFATMFLANPDLPARIANGGPYNDADRATFYGGDEHGYLDYPAAQ